MVRAHWQQLVVILVVSGALGGARAAAQSKKQETDIPIQRCGRLPVVTVQVDKEDKRFLVDTAATSFLNRMSFNGRDAREISIQSWNATTALHAGYVPVDEISIGKHVVRNVQLAAIDLSAISQTCGGQLDGILGLDLLEKLGVTIDLERGVVHLGPSAEPSADVSVAAGIEDAVNSCLDAFNRADAERLASCFDSEFALTSPRGELHGRDEAMNYLRQYFGASPHGHLSFRMRDARPLGELVWGVYEYSIEAPFVRTDGRGIMLCRKAEDHWYVLSMYESPAIAATAKP
jgi:hypothetical protein